MLSGVSIPNKVNAFLNACCKAHNNAKRAAETSLLFSSRIFD
jgi:hypothetical protein